MSLPQLNNNIYNRIFLVYQIFGYRLTSLFRAHSSPREPIFQEQRRDDSGVALSK